VYSAYAPGELIQDEFLDASLGGPIMVVIPAGSFFMGSTDTETDRFKNEGPVRRVVFDRGFAIGQLELSIAEFAAFIAATGYVTDAEKKGNSRIYDSRSGMLTYRKNVKWNSNYLGRPGDDELPVLHVSWNDATEYARWLSRKTGKIYRLPSEAEFEYALRAGNAVRYWWGDKSPIETVTNITGDGDVSNNRRRWDAGFEGYKDGHWGPAPVRSFLPNPFGLYDMGGNVSEWTDDCWHGNYIHAPAGPEAWINPGCSRRVVRGGSWSSTPAQTRSAFRLSALPETHGSLVGFRLVREL
jgi:formylglycine-generating enzyme required for sulfatase activity